MLLSLPTILLTTLLIRIAAAQNPSSISSPSNTEGPDLEPRAGFRIPGKVADDTDSPTPGGRLRDDPETAPLSPGGIGSDSPGSSPGSSGSSGRYRDPVPIIRNPSDPSDNALIYGHADKTYNPCYRDREDCLEMANIAVDLTEKLVDAGSDDKSSTRTSNNEPTAASSSSTSRIGATGEAIAIPNLNMSDWMSGRLYNHVFTFKEFELLQSDPLCFFATYERIYRHIVPLAGSSASAKDTRGPEPTKAVKAREQYCPLGPATCEEAIDKDEQARQLYLSYHKDNDVPGICHLRDDDDNRRVHDRVRCVWVP